MRSTLTLAGISALLASTCCVMPLVFALVGISGAWIVYMRVLEPYSNALAGLAFIALGVSAWRLYRPSWPSRSANCEAGDAACSQVTHVTRNARRWFWFVLVLAFVPLVVPLAAPLFY